MSNKMDGYSSRTPADIERRFNFGKSFSEVMGVAKDAQNHALKAEEVAKSVEAKVLNINVVEELNASAGVITLNSNRLVVNSDKFSLSADGEIEATAGKVGKWDISSNGIFKICDNYCISINSPEAVGSDFITVAFGMYDEDTKVFTPKNYPLRFTAKGDIYSIGKIYCSASDGALSAIIEEGCITIDSTAFNCDISSSGIVVLDTYDSLRASLTPYRLTLNNSTIENKTTYAQITGSWRSNTLIFNSPLDFFDFYYGEDRMGGAKMLNNTRLLELSGDIGNQISMRLYGYGTNQLGGNWSSDTAIQVTSDANYKNSITDFDERYGVLFDNLRPIVHKYNDGQSGRYHAGYIAQEVDEALKKAGLTRLDFAGLCIDDEGLESEKWSLRYTEFVPLNTYEIQKLKQRFAKLEKILGVATNE